MLHGDRHLLDRFGNSVTLNSEIISEFREIPDRTLLVFDSGVNILIVSKEFNFPNNSGIDH